MILSFPPIHPERVGEALNLESLRVSRRAPDVGLGKDRPPNAVALDRLPVFAGSLAAHAVLGFRPRYRPLGRRICDVVEHVLAWLGLP
jgi:hypothetical protein